MLTTLDNRNHTPSRDAPDLNSFRGWCKLKVLDDADKNGLHFQNAKKFGQNYDGFAMAMD